MPGYKILGIACDENFSASGVVPLTPYQGRALDEMRS